MHSPIPEFSHSTAPPGAPIVSPTAIRLEERSYAARRIFLWGQIDDASARHVIERLLAFDAEDPESDILLVINSPGGLNTSGFSILDVMEAVRPDVATLCMGLAASFGALLLACGSPGKRYALPHARIMIHQPWVPGQITGPASDVRIHAEEIQKQRREINRILAERSGRTIEELEADTDRDYWLDAPEAARYGLIDAAGSEPLFSDSSPPRPAGFRTDR